MNAFATPKATYYLFTKVRDAYEVVVLDDIYEAIQALKNCITGDYLVSVTKGGLFKPCVYIRSVDGKWVQNILGALPKEILVYFKVIGIDL